MAKLTLNQAQRKIEREKAKQEAIKKKIEIQKKKELYGEDWKKVEQQKLQDDIEKEIGGDTTPKIYDSQDLYNYFEPILFYKDPDNKRLEMDFKKFAESEEKYKSALAEIDAELAQIKNENGEQQDEVVQETVEESRYENDGDCETDEELPIEASDLDENEQLIDSSKIDTPAARAKGKLNQIVATYLNRFVPIYNKHICTCCGAPKQLSDYYVVYNITCSDRVDDRGAYHMWICKDCVQKLFAYLYSVLAQKNLELAMQYLCANLNLYWDVDIFYQAKQTYEDTNRTGTLVGCYVSALNKTAVGLTFMDSPFLADEQYNSTIRTGSLAIDEAPYDWSKEDARNKKDVVHIFGYDPFEFEEDENEKKILYADLVSVVDEDVQQDYVKLQSALTIVKSFNKVRKLDERAHQLERDEASLREQKDLADLKAKELKAISDFSRDSGFSERFKTRQSQGQTSFTGIMKTMNEKKFEDELINKYDIATSSTIQAAADASFKAIFNQLNLSEAEAYKIAAEQLEELRKVKKENEKLQETLRQTRYELTELQLKEKAREKGVIVDGD